MLIAPEQYSVPVSSGYYLREELTSILRKVLDQKTTTLISPLMDNSFHNITDIIINIISMFVSKSFCMT